MDLGAILLPGVQGMELRMEIDKATDVVSAASILLDGSSLQVQAFAAPRTEGIWDEIRAEIAESVTQQGGSADDLPGPFGRELLARLPVRTPEGRTGHRPARFIGADGPRWFVRGVRDRHGPPSTRRPRPPSSRSSPASSSCAAPTRARRATCSRCGCPARARRTSRPPRPTQEQPAAPDFDPLTRGPEITEIR